MIVFASALKFHAQNVGMRVPEDVQDYDALQFPHWYVYCLLQLGRPIVGDSVARNARIIADIPHNRIEKISYNEIVDLGFV
jgi:hypothetical protein